MDQNEKKDVAALRAQGIPDELIAQYLEIKRDLNQEIEMSQSDGMRIASRNADAEGVYISSYLRAQDAFAQAMARAQQEDQLAANNRLNAPASPVNPNVRVETEGQNVTALPNGTIVYY